MRRTDAKVSLMRTTVRIDDQLYRRVKERAAREGRTVASVLEDAVRIGISASDDTQVADFVTPTGGRGGLVPGIDLSSNSALRDVLDDDASLEQLR
jgi:predicted DNA-binding protein